MQYPPSSTAPSIASRPEPDARVRCSCGATLMRLAPRQRLVSSGGAAHHLECPSCRRRVTALVEG